MLLDNLPVFQGQQEQPSIIACVESLDVRSPEPSLLPLQRMAERVLSSLREKVRSRRYVITLHAEEEMRNDEITTYDVESAILTGRIISSQVDKQRGGRKYLICGWTAGGEESLNVVVKLGPTGRLVVITVYLD